MPKPTRSIKIVMKMMTNGDRLFAICCERSLWIRDNSYSFVQFVADLP